MRLTSICIFLLWTVISTTQAQIKAPPGTIQIGTNLFYDQNEISNIHYLEFLHYIKIDSTKDYYLQSLPDTTLIISEHVQIKDTTFTNEIYLRYPKTRKFPVVGITYEQASDYCEWRTAMVKKLLAEKEELDTTQYAIQYRLPTLEEWIKIAIANDYDFTFRKDMFRNLTKATMSRKTLKSIAKENDFDLSGKEYEIFLIEYLKLHPIHFVDNLAYKGDDKRLSKAINHYFPSSSRDYDEQKPQIYDIRGNVSEMTSTKGIAKGGNWQSAEGEISVWDNVKYDKPSALIGFRCICEVNEVEN